jgi:hypothetical protein
MEEDMMYKAEPDSTITYKEIKKAIFDLKKGKKGKSAGPDRILNEVIKYTKAKKKICVFTVTRPTLIFASDPMNFFTEFG